MAVKIVIASGKGGVGKSSVTAGLSCALHNAGSRVLAVDCDVGLSSLDIMLSAGSEVLFNWGDLLCGHCAFEQARVRTGLGPDLLCAPKRTEEVFTGGAMRKMISDFDYKYDYIFFDAPAGIGSGLELAGSAADKAVIVATPDEICVRSGALAAQALEDNGITDFRLIINRFNSKAAIKKKLLNIDDVIDNTYLRLIGVVPQDFSVNFNLNRGKPLPSSSPAKAAFDRIAGRLQGKRVHLKID